MSKINTSHSRVLLVDDETDIAFVLKNGLQSQGYDVETFCSSTDAAATDANLYDIAILDIRMPNMNGFQLARSLWDQNDKLQVCFLSAFEINKKEAETTLLNLKSHCFLTKPMLPSALAMHIEAHFANQ